MTARRAAPGAALIALVVGVFAPAVGASEGSADDAALRERILTGIAGLPDLAGEGIVVAVREGRVVLQGRVRLLEHSLRAEQTAWRTPGVVDVDNELRIVPLAAAGDEAIERQVRLIVKGDGRFTDTTLAIEVSGGVVRVGGMFHDPRDVLELKHRVASIPGVLAVEIRARLFASRGQVGFPRPDAPSRYSAAAPG